MLELKNISFVVDDIDGKKEILKNINLQLEKNKIYVITGPNGGGKSSLAKILMGIYAPTEGRIIFEGQDITDKDITERAKLKIGYAFQNPPRFKGMTVRELLKISSSKDKIEECDIRKLLLDVGLCGNEYLNREVDASLSGGEMKRIEIASILARDLNLTILDEPEAGIDLWSFQKLAETFSDLHEKTDATMVIISHQERILELADEVILINNGEIQEITDKDKILEDITNQANCRCRQNCGKGVGQNVGLSR